LFHKIFSITKKINSEYEHEIIPVIIEPYAKIHNCFPNVDEKVKKDKGKAHYGWAIYQSDILCEAERHAVWENPEGDLIDITPQEPNVDTIMFVSDNNFIYTGQLVDNIRVNITNNPVVDDFIYICENTEKLYTYGHRINNEQMIIPEPAMNLISTYQQMKIAYLEYIRGGGNLNKPCICGSTKSYKECHRKKILNDINSSMLKIEEILKK
jgi:hypothetical protein